MIKIFKILCIGFIFTPLKTEFLNINLLDVCFSKANAMESSEMNKFRQQIDEYKSKDYISLYLKFLADNQGEFENTADKYSLEDLSKLKKRAKEVWVTVMKNNILKIRDADHTKAKENWDNYIADMKLLDFPLSAELVERGDGIFNYKDINEYKNKFENNSIIQKTTWYNSRPSTVYGTSKSNNDLLECFIKDADSARESYKKACDELINLQKISYPKFLDD